MVERCDQESIVVMEFIRSVVSRSGMFHPLVKVHFATEWISGWDSFSLAVGFYSKVDDRYPVRQVARFSSPKISYRFKLLNLFTIILRHLIVSFFKAVVPQLYVSGETTVKIKYSYPSLIFWWSFKRM